LGFSLSALPWSGRVKPAERGCSFQVWAAETFSMILKKVIDRVGAVWLD